jgi:hypothetical protein
VIVLGCDVGGSDPRDRILEIVKRRAGAGVAVRDLVAVGLSRGVAHGALTALLDEGRVANVGRGAALRYVLMEYAPADWQSPPVPDLIGGRYGRLVVQEKALPCARGRCWLALCDCGQSAVVVEHDLLYCTRSCGCMAADASATTSRRRTARVRALFWTRIRKSDGCWEWQGCKSTAGYGKAGRDRLAHRVAWELTNGPIPEGLCVCHTCDNPPCCNPDHLFLGTHADNMADKVAKGRQPSGEHHHWRRLEVPTRGECNPSAKLTRAQVIDIRIRYGAGEPPRPLATEYGVCPETIASIVKGRSWQCVPMEQSC